MQHQVRQERLEAIRAEVQARLARRRMTASAPVPPPRYDEVFEAGLEWLNALAGEPIAESEGKLELALEDPDDGNGS
jgi:hypothetical protein